MLENTLTPFNTFKSGLGFDIDRVSLEATASNYLNLGVRSQYFDRSMVLSLVMAEIYGFARECYYPTFTNRQNAYLKMPHPSWRFLKGAFYETIFLLIVGIILYFAFLSIGKENWGAISSVLVAGLWFISTAWMAISTPFYWLNRSKTRKQTTKLISEMLSVHAALDSVGGLSAKHIRERAKHAADAGVVWPAPLFTLLEDVERRGGIL